MTSSVREWSDSAAARPVRTLRAVAAVALAAVAGCVVPPPVVPTPMSVPLSAAAIPVCEIESEAWSWIDSPALRVTVDGPPYVQLRWPVPGPHVRMGLVESAPEGPLHAFVEAEGNSIRLRGLMAPEELRLYTDRSLSFGGWLTMGARSAFQPLRRLPGGEIALELRDSFVGQGSLVEPVQPVRISVPCEALTLDSRTRVKRPDPEVVAGERVQIRGGAAVPLRATPDGPIVANYHFGDWQEARRLSQQGDLVEVQVALYKLSTQGWVPASDVRPYERGEREIPSGVIGSVEGLPRGQARGVRRCVAGIPLFVIVKGKLAEVGELLPGARLAIPTMSAYPYARAWLAVGRWLPLDGVQWSVRTSDLQSCPREDGTPDE